MFAGAVLAPSSAGVFKLLLFAAAYIVCGADVLIKAVGNLFSGNVFDENFLMSLAGVGAICIGAYSEAVAVMLFYQIGELFQGCAVDKSRRSIAELMNIRPDSANVLRGGQSVSVSPDEVAAGEAIIVKPGERIPLDGVVVSGSSAVDTSALTGESLPLDVCEGSGVLSGCINMSGLITVRVTKRFSESTVCKLLDLVENAAGKKSASENFITKFARVYTPAVVVCAALLAFAPPVLFSGQTFSDWIYRALTFLVVSCPCALVISVPLAFFGGIGGASKIGVLIKGGNYLEALAHTEIAVFDKTGTLTKGVFEVTQAYPEGISRQELIKTAAYAENYSNHPIALSLRRAYGQDINEALISDPQEAAGYGLSAVVEGRRVLIGNAKYMARENISFSQREANGTAVYVARDGIYLGCIFISDVVKEEAFAAIASMKALGIKKTVMLTGDGALAAKAAAETLNMDEYRCNLLPAQKVEIIEALLLQKSKKGKVAFIGDGINDAPVLARADVGIAMGALGSDAAIEAADVVLMTDELTKIPQALKAAGRTLAISNQNIVFALSVKFAVLILGALGFATMWEAVFADVGVAVIAVLNSMRALNIKKISRRS